MRNHSSEAAKVGARIAVSIRRTSLSLSSGYPEQALFQRVLQQLRS